ncbi:Fic family protein [soil metagenome]
MADGGREVSLGWRGLTVRAWLPEKLQGRTVTLSERTVRSTEQAAAAVREIASRVPTGFEPLARLLLRAEGLASSQVEQIRAPIADVVLAEVYEGVGVAAHVADNLKVVKEALVHASGTAPLTAEVLHAWHRQMMTHGSLPDGLIASWRSQIGWIGGATPAEAVFVPAPPDSIERLMDDLLLTANACPWDPVTTAAVVHAQFETIHPYADGNGRVGRVLALWLLARKLEGVTVPPPMSVLIAQDTNSYIAALGAFRIGMDDQLVHWFASVIIPAAHASINWAEKLDTLVDNWHGRTEGFRSDAASRRLLPILARFPLLSAEIAAEQLGVTLPAARNGLDALVETGIVIDHGTVASGPGRPRRWWSAPELLDLLRQGPM